MSDIETIKVYDAKATEYAARFDSDEPDAWITSFIDAMPEAGNVLELGCGPGRIAAKMIEAGLVVDAVDASQEMASIAKQKYGVEVRVAMFADIAGTDIYDGIWANFSLLHAPKADLPNHLAALHAALKPKGRLHLGMKLGTGEQRDTIGRFYAYYTQAELTNHLKTAGFSVNRYGTGQSKGLAGFPEPWIIITAHG
ncbi:MAG: SAM-dependent methyltransferase [Paracoccaceae bacterium]|jgi:SAM-dependent methyltransferase|tara:strand:+ start:95 stop:685 length:591 start_codon:yes stop_codon:yes gene_type:complete